MNVGKSRPMVRQPNPTGKEVMFVKYMLEPNDVLLPDDPEDMETLCRRKDWPPPPCTFDWAYPMYGVIEEPIDI
jgi:hypothetical protein